MGDLVLWGNELVWDLLLQFSDLPGPLPWHIMKKNKCLHIVPIQFPGRIHKLRLKEEGAFNSSSYQCLRLNFIHRACFHPGVNSLEIIFKFAILVLPCLLLSDLLKNKIWLHLCLKSFNGFSHCLWGLIQTLYYDART